MTDDSREAPIETAGTADRDASGRFLCACEVEEQNGAGVEAIQPNGTGRTSISERDEAGRFVLGNLAAVGAGGNAGRMREFREALLGCVTPAEFATLGRKLYAQALDGDIGASAILCSYFVGKPVPIDPDRGDGVAEALALQYRLLYSRSEREEQLEAENERLRAQIQAPRLSR